VGVGGGGEEKGVGWGGVNNAIRQGTIAMSDRYKSGVDPRPMSVECRPAGGI